MVGAGNVSWPARRHRRHLPRLRKNSRPARRAGRVVAPRGCQITEQRDFLVGTTIVTIEKYRHPILFYALCTAVPWALWFAAAYLSHTDTHPVALGLLGVAGLFAPAVIAFSMIWAD